MKRRIFTEEERLELEKNPNILKVLNSNVEFCEEFKSRVVREHDKEGIDCYRNVLYKGLSPEAAHQDMVHDLTINRLGLSIGRSGNWN